MKKPFSLARRQPCLVFLVVIAVAIGCDSAIGPTSGRVHFSDGSPVQSGSIEFRSLDDKKRYASTISQDGTFRPEDREGNSGLPPGDYEVVVVQMVLTEDLAAELHNHGNTVPRRYADYYTSGLRTEVKSADKDGKLEVIIEPE